MAWKSTLVAAYGDQGAYDGLLKKLSEEMKPVRSSLYDSGVSFPRVSRYVEKGEEAARAAR